MTYYLKLKSIHQYMRKVNCSDADLAHAIREMSAGLIDADLGGNLFKKRIPLSGKGKSGSLRTIIATRKADRWIVVAMWSKSDMSNISQSELKQYKMMAKYLLGTPDKIIDEYLEEGDLIRIKAEI